MTPEISFVKKEFIQQRKIGPRMSASIQELEVHLVLAGREQTHALLQRDFAAWVDF